MSKAIRFQGLTDTTENLNADRFQGRFAYDTTKFRWVVCTDGTDYAEFARAKTLTAGNPVWVAADGAIEDASYIRLSVDVTPTTSANTNYATAPLQARRVATSGTETAAGVGFANIGANGAFLYLDPANNEFRYNRDTASALVRMWDSDNMPISTFAKTILDDTDAATFRETIGAAEDLGYTPLNKAGDTMTGAFVTSVDADQSFAAIGLSVDDNALLISGGATKSAAASLILSGGDASSDYGWALSTPYGKTFMGGQILVGGTVGLAIADRSNISNAVPIYNGGNKILSDRKTGWTAATGSATRSTFATGSVTLPVLAEHVKALIDDLISHGLIGA